MEFLDEKGHDRLTVGESLIPQSRGRVLADFHRIGAAVGIILHDTEGNERGGMSWLSNGRGAIAFDYLERDAIGMYVDDKGDTDKAPGEVKAAPCEDSISPLGGGRL